MPEAQSLLHTKWPLFLYVYSCACNRAFTEYKEAVFRYAYKRASSRALTVYKVVSLYVCVEMCLQRSPYSIQGGSVYVCAELCPQHCPCWYKMTRSSCPCLAAKPLQVKSLVFISATISFNKKISKELWRYSFRTTPAFNSTKQRHALKSVVLSFRFRHFASLVQSS